MKILIFTQQQIYRRCTSTLVSCPTQSQTYLSHEMSVIYHDSTICMNGASQTNCILNRDNILLTANDTFIHQHLDFICNHMTGYIQVTVMPFGQVFRIKKRVLPRVIYVRMSHNMAIWFHIGSCAGTTSEIGSC